MDSQNPSVRAHAASRRARKNHSSGAGVVHDNSRHTSRFTVIGNHLAQHGELSLVAIGLSAHIQSLPTGAAVDIKSLAARFPEGAVRIAGALRELEAHGYLRRTRERTSNGRMVTRTVSCNQPGHRKSADGGNGDDGETPVAPKPKPQPQDPPRPQDRPRRRALPAVPQPGVLATDLLLTALDVLARLRQEDARLVLSTTDTDHLAPGIVAWLERDVSADAVCHALTKDVPHPLHRPAAFLAHRLTALLPPAPPLKPAPKKVVPLVDCDGCYRVFRGPEGGLCRDCRTKESHGRLTP